MANDSRPSLTKDIEQRYDSQRAGGAFDVKDTLGTPNTSVPAGKLIDATSMNATQFQNPAGFETKVTMQQSRFLVVQSNGTSGVSRYVKTLDNRRYKR